MTLTLECYDAENSDCVLLKCAHSIVWTQEQHHPLVVNVKVLFSSHSIEVQYS
jgi:hypothetical protein